MGEVINFEERRKAYTEKLVNNSANFICEFIEGVNERILNSDEIHFERINVLLHCVGYSDLRKEASRQAIDMERFDLRLMELTEEFSKLTTINYIPLEISELSKVKY